MNLSDIYNLPIIIDRDIDIPNQIVIARGVTILAEAALLPTPPVTLGIAVGIAPPLGETIVLRVLMAAETVAMFVTGVG